MHNCTKPRSEPSFDRPTPMCWPNSYYSPHNTKSSTTLWRVFVFQNYEKEALGWVADCSKVKASSNLSFHLMKCSWYNALRVWELWWPRITSKSYGRDDGSINSINQGIELTRLLSSPIVFLSWLAWKTWCTKLWAALPTHFDTMNGPQYHIGSFIHCPLFIVLDRWRALR